jgi:SNF2 family DNA or RNA helicase
MGVGKTIQALALCSIYGKQNSIILVICPAGLTEQWKEEARKWLK